MVRNKKSGTRGLRASGGRQKIAASAPDSGPGLAEFDELYYTSRYKDVADAITAGVWHNGLMHYASSGRASGRVAAPAVDEAWYGSAYPLASVEVAAGKARTFADHYHRIGRYRGYLAAPMGVRPEDPGRTLSRYGGLWTDHGNAMDLIDGRLDLGRLTAQEAALLRHWVTSGYVILPQAVPEELLAPAVRDLERAYWGDNPQLRFDIDDVGRRVPWAAESQVNPSRVLDLHWHSEAVRNAIFAPAIVAFLHLIFERRALASQSLGFWLGSAHDGTQDSAEVGFSLPMQFAASWIAFEDVTEGAGEPLLQVGSHRIGEYRFHNRFKGVTEARRLGFSEAHTQAQSAQQVERIEKQVRGLGLRTERCQIKRGDALIWAADLVHGVGPVSGSQTRKSLLTHYCPADCAPSYFERSPSALRRHGAEFYASGYYTK